MNRLNTFNSFFYIFILLLWIITSLIMHIECGRDFYKILEIKNSATIEEIKKSYRRLTLKYHPDRNKDPSAVKKFQDIATAYEVLSDTEKREKYDNYGEEGLREDYGSSDDFMNFFDFGGSFGGGFFFGHQQQNRLKKESLTFDLYLDLSQLYFGDLLYVVFTRPVLCSKLKDCIYTQKECSSAGIRTTTKNVGPGFFIQNQMHDPTCIDKGKAIKANCPVCPTGTTEMQKASTSLYIDTGMQGGDTVTFERGGTQEIGYELGDLIFNIVELPHPSFQRHGSTLSTTVYITLLESLVGFTATFDHISKKTFTVTRTNVTHDGETEIIPDWGMPIRNQANTYGSLKITYRVQYPTSLSEESRQLITTALSNVTKWKYEIPVLS